MKTKRRHELQTNQLADSLGHFIDAAKPYASWVGLAILAICAVGAAIYVISARNAADEGKAWADFFAARSQSDADQLRELAKQGAGSEAGLWALQSAGDVDLNEGVAALLVDRDESASALKRAKSAYQQVASSAPQNSMLRQRALYGLAQAHESLGELNEAKKHYQQVIDEWPDTMIGKEAQSRLEAVSQKSTVEWYAFLAQYEPPKRNPLPDLPGADRDLFDMDLPDSPTSPFSSLNDELDGAPSPGAATDGQAKDAGDVAPGEGDSQPPSEEDAKKADPAPAAESGDAPAASNKPAEEDAAAASPPAEGASAEEKPAPPATSDSP